MAEITSSGGKAFAFKANVAAMLNGSGTNGSIAEVAKAQA